MNVATDIEIMERLQSRAVELGKHLTYTQKLFFLRLLDYAAKDGGEPCSEGLKVSLSVSDMAYRLKISKRMIIQSLRVLSECGILLRYKGERNSFPPGADTTMIKKEFYEKE